MPEDQRARLHDYFDSGRPIVSFRTANHGFIGLDYRMGDRRINFGEEVLGGSFRSHHGRWHQDSTRATVIPESAEHPVVLGVEDVWGPSDVYRTYPEGGALPAGCTPLLMGQPLTGRVIRRVNSTRASALSRCSRPGTSWRTSGSCQRIFWVGSTRPSGFRPKRTVV